APGGDAGGDRLGRRARRGDPPRSRRARGRRLPRGACGAARRSGHRARPRAGGGDPVGALKGATVPSTESPAATPRGRSPPTTQRKETAMSVLGRTALEDSPLADLHELASELGIDGFRRLRKAALVDAILARQGGEDRAVAEEAAPVEV